ncbi:MAG TPA: phenylalanine--tRNA ligase beta subunit-related protein [Hyphomicrobiales bacterium]|nr:phenylalanine--tRNA ligase beta subunit-related protein [Kaistiaceae bacterium]HQF30229.1 phenylalanine--tRNA ligase beta subunit-related protein [Hyphomicrobiales bacterium]
MQIDISEIAPAFPDFALAAVVFELGRNPVERPAELDALVAEREAACRAEHAGMELSAIPGIAAWRRAYRAFGIKKTSYRSSVERLVKNVLAERELARINSFVDAYNTVSLSHVLPLGADDLDKVVGDIAFRYARADDSFRDMAGDGEGAGVDRDDRDDPPKPGEVVYADAEKVLCRRWNWRQDVRSLVTPETRRVVLTLQANGYGDLDAAVADLLDLAARFCEARAAVTRLDAARPTATLALP